jgi:ABC-type sugar transport system ATPase subunit
MVARGLGVLMISSELPEILSHERPHPRPASRAIAGELTREEATAERVLALALGRPSRRPHRGTDHRDDA